MADGGNLVVAVAVTVPVAARAGLMPGPRAAPRLAVLGGVALGLADVTVTTALQEGPLTVASVLTNLYPLVTITLGVAVMESGFIRGMRLASCSPSRVSR